VNVVKEQPFLGFENFCHSTASSKMANIRKSTFQEKLAQNKLFIV